ncbi:transcription repressor OFP13-like [Hordeum vulgare subsp. vulgare]|uniref:Transcription repressor n=1 Tax=Hordeum vulgare subsp. vulgare TaxID=112509 RepID=A0A8I6WLE6_HORVV|nr:transcription repressor OFP13-like [Hordeum vulgare subsp. vulgare]
MVKKLALASLFFPGNDAAASLSCSPRPSMSAASSGSAAASWQWPSCAQARTASFDGRSSVEAEASWSAASARRDCCRTTRVITNPAYCDRDDTADSSFVSATASSSTSTAATAPEPEPSADEAVIRGIRASSRLFFEPEATKSIVTTSKPAAFGGATALAIDSADPYGDFRRSMEEMVLSRGGGRGEDDWGWLEEMLGWYLRANGKKTHGLIVGAFVDLLVGLSAVNDKQSGRC